MESDVEILAELKNIVYLDKSMNITCLPEEVKTNLRTFPVLWPVLEGLGKAEPGRFIDDKQSMRIELGKWDYGIVVAVAEGVVKKIEHYCSSKDKTTCKVVIQHKNNISSVYSPVDVCENIKVGDWVCQGDLIGYLYKNMNATEKHYVLNYYKKYLDFALKKDADYINPLQVLHTFNERLYFDYEK
jgi:hypothetical protein